MAGKKYTAREASSLLPYLAPTLVELRDKAERANVLRAKVTAAARSNGGSPDSAKWSHLLARVEELLHRLEDWEVVVRDPASGLVDFPTEIEGRRAWLCWRLGEAEVSYWHWPQEGFAGRRPL